MLKDRRWSIALPGYPGILYLALYTLLNLEDFALLSGSALLIMALSAALYLTRNLDWYALTEPGVGEIDTQNRLRRTST